MKIFYPLLPTNVTKFTEFRSKVKRFCMIITGFLGKKELSDEFLYRKDVLRKFLRGRVKFLL